MIIGRENLGTGYWGVLLLCRNFIGFIMGCVISCIVFQL